MANLNKVMLIGRLTRDPEVRTVSTGGKVAKIGFAVNNRKKNQQTGQWEDEPVYIDVDAWNRENGRKLADLVEQYLRRGSQVYLEGNLVLDQWVDKDGQKRSKLKLNLHDLQFLDGKQDGGGTVAGGDEEGLPAPAVRPARASAAAAPARQAPARSAQAPQKMYEGEPDDALESPARGGNDDDIPF